MAEPDLLEPVPALRLSRMTEAAKMFHQSLNDECREYVDGRGLESQIGRFMLGTVPEDCGAEWSPYRGMLSIPYINLNNQVVQIKFRNLREEGPKYLNLPSLPTSPFNMKAVDSGSRTINVTEGEFDAMSLASLGYAAISIPGASNWKPYYRNMLDNFERVVLWGDPDDAGQSFNAAVQDSVRKATVAYLSTDINDALVEGNWTGISDAFIRAGGEQ